MKGKKKTCEIDIHSCLFKHVIFFSQGKLGQRGDKVRLFLTEIHLFFFKKWEKVSDFYLLHRGRGVSAALQESKETEYDNSIDKNYY